MNGCDDADDDGVDGGDRGGGGDCFGMVGMKLAQKEPANNETGYNERR